MKHTPLIRAFREWTRGVSFTLTMGKTQTAVLVSLAASRGRQFPLGRDHKLLRLFVVSAHALVERGLVEYVARTRADVDSPIGEVWPLTAAGVAVIDLLKLSGVYEEVSRELEESDQARMRRDRTLRMRVA